MVREYVDHRNMSLYRMLGEATGERPPFDEVVVTDVSLLGDTEEEVQERIPELGDKRVRVRVMDSNEHPST